MPPLIEKRTVLVLGAGASAPYGLPVGKDLRDRIAGALAPGSLRFQQLKKFGFADEAIKAFVRDLPIAAGTTMDEFLELRPEFGDLGRAAIAQALIPCEGNEPVHRYEQKGPFWYKEFLGNMAMSRDSSAHRNLAIVTFNYDRSLEEFLFTTYKASHSQAPEEAAGWVKGLSIVHVYGWLAPLEWYDGACGIPYGAECTDHAIRQAMENIRIIDDEAPTSPELAKAQERLEDAEVIAFLGFGYNDTNLQRLVVKKLEKNGKLIVGTSQGLEADRIQELREWMTDTRHCDIWYFLKHEFNLWRGQLRGRHPRSHPPDRSPSPPS